MKLTKNITICGIKHAGKTCAAVQLARLLDCRCIDTDDALKELYRWETGKNCSCREIFRELGEKNFRELEAGAVRHICSGEKHCVIALGGGVLSNENLREEDRTGLGFICCLDVPDEVAYSRIAAEGLPPFLQSEPDPYAAFCAQNTERRKIFYERSHAVFKPDGMTPEETARHILNLCREIIK